MFSRVVNLGFCWKNVGLLVPGIRPRDSIGLKDLERSFSLIRSQEPSKVAFAVALAWEQARGEYFPQAEVVRLRFLQEF